MITINELNFSYSKGQKLLEQLNLELHQGHIYGLLGKNGVGKSTLLKLMCGLLSPQSGSVSAWGVTPMERKPSFLSQVYYLVETPDIPNMSMRQYITLNAPFYPNFNHKELLDYMSQMNVDYNQNISKMSMGQSKKALIAFGLACNTKLIIMDEPTNGLDIPSKGSFRRIISSVMTEDRYIIISTHQVRDLESLIDGIIIMDGGHILLNETTDQISRKLSFQSVDGCDTSLYEEQTPLGRRGVVENLTGDESRVDIELLFNAAMNNGAKLTDIFKSKESK